MAKRAHKGSGAQTSYRVLARKYRPQSFDDLIGQEAMVHILTAAFETGRVAHAYMLTGVRGVGKTTTARLLARALNYTNEKGESTLTIEMGKPGVHCESIAESRHMDVLEMDAASRTGIDDIREIIEGAQFKPASAPYKVYIIDEVHMLSKAAFNGLLKILEEPPEHVKFIFATTEVRKVPVTVLSRCQRFDLKRVEPDQLIEHLKNVAKKEGVKTKKEALALIARASEGSVRDALSLLDQAIAQSAAGSEVIEEPQVRDMLGLADRARILDLLDHLFQGDIKSALGELKAQYNLGADPLEVLRDLLELTHWLTRLQITGESGAQADMSKAQHTRGLEMANKLSMGTLARSWQILLKGLGEAQTAPRALDAAEMILVRLAYASDLPTPDDIIRRGGTGTSKEAPTTASAPKKTKSRGGGREPTAQLRSETSALAQQPAATAQSSVATEAIAETFEDVLELAGAKRDIRLRTELETYVHLVRFEPGRIEFRPAANAPDNLAGRLASQLTHWTGTRWIVSLSNDEGANTIQGVRRQKEENRDAKLKEHPLVKAALEEFPNAKIVDIRERESSGDAPVDDD